MLTGIGRIGADRRAQRARRGAAATGFALPENTAAESPLRAQDPHAAHQSAATQQASMMSLLEFQADDADAERNRRACARTESLLDALATLQGAVLAGRMDVEKLERLAALATAPNEARDPVLAEIADWVALRAQVMIARLTQG